MRNVGQVPLLEANLAAALGLGPIRTPLAAPGTVCQRNLRCIEHRAADVWGAVVTLTAQDTEVDVRCKFIDSVSVPLKLRYQQRGSRLQLYDHEVRQLLDGFVMAKMVKHKSSSCSTGLPGQLAQVAEEGRLPYLELVNLGGMNGSPAANAHGSVGLSLPGDSLMEDTWQSFMRKHHRKDWSGIVIKDLHIPDWFAFPIADEVTKERMLNMLSVVSDMVLNRVGGSSNEEIRSGSPMFSTAESIDAGGVAPTVVRMVLQFELETLLLQRDGTTGYLALAFRPITEVMKDQTRLKHLGAFFGYIVSHIILDDPIYLAIFAYFGGGEEEVIKLLLAHQELRIGWSEVRSNFYNQICDAAENDNNLLVGSFWQNISLLVEHRQQRTCVKLCELPPNLGAFKETVISKPDGLSALTTYLSEMRQPVHSHGLH
ncbi:hypothetical protein BJ742DRAFT_898735 [Cladochytrium replicatum]|nr:hypothetical protein BJ742DRAFT_898735 [Cladochytrium replicatum]